MPVIYGGYDLRPCETVALEKADRTTEDGRYLGSVTRATLRGKITPECIDAVVTPLPTDQHLSAILALQKEIDAAFSTPGLLLELQGWDGSSPAKLPARKVSIQFMPGNWLEVCDYEIVMEGLEFSGRQGDDQSVESAGQSWSFEQSENPKVIRATHAVQAKGVTLYDGNGVIPTPAWQLARTFVRSKLGLGWATVGDPYWSPQSGQQVAASSDLLPLPGSLSAWNRVVTEQVDELGGSYQATETWLLNALDYWQESTASVQRSSDDQGYVVQVNLSGTIHGLHVDQADLDARLTNAIAAFATLSAGFQATAVAAAGPGVTLNPHPVSFSSDQNPLEGTVAYQYAYNNRVLVNDTWELYGVQKKASLEDYKTSVTVDGKIYGAVYPDVESDPLLKLERARAQWDRVKGMLYARAVQSTGIANLQLCPLSADQSVDQSEGSVSYSYTFDNRLFNTVEEEFTVSRKASGDDPKVTVVVEGTIKGLRTSTCTDPFQTPIDPFEALANAQAYFAQIEAGLVSRAALYVKVDDLNPAPWATSISQNLYAGTVGYSFEFNSLRHCFPFALSESISYTDDAATRVVAVIPVPGRAQGPVFQDMATTKERRRTLSIELILAIPANPCGFQPAPIVDISPWAPKGSAAFLEQDQTTFSADTGRFSRQATWIYTS